MNGAGRENKPLACALQLCSKQASARDFDLRTPFANRKSRSLLAFHTEL